MKIQTLVLAGCVLTTGLGLTARAQDTSAGSSSGSMERAGEKADAQTQGMKKTYERETTMSDADLRKVAIQVKDVDEKNHTVTFQAQVSPEANIKKNGQTIKMNQLKPGDEVRASFDPKTGTVMKLEIERPGSKSSKQPKSGGSQE